ncbi:uncharacterized protein V1516DRAFT_628480 [Lipomyces oligophaga]|uniref:uncharacterized protein n=1 Tax=Lipomyces oligophaga TaxID=45792 RepID=UPI0034CE2A4B
MNIPKESRNICFGCKNLLDCSTIVAAVGHKYHPQCFKCCHCLASLEYCEFYPNNGKLYCHLDFHELFSPKCSYCNTPIEGQVVTAMGNSYHVEHFFCAGCSTIISLKESYHARDNQAWCHKCFTERFFTKCWKCREAIPEGEFIIRVLDRDWCSQCFSCEYRNAPHRLAMMDSSFEMMERLFVSDANRRG